MALRLTAGAGATLGLALFAISCSGRDVTPTQPATSVLTTLAVSLAQSTITVGQTTVATTTGKDQFGAAIAVPSVNWSSSNPTVASVNAGGVVTGLAAGQAVIGATSGAVSGSASITVLSSTPSVAACKLPEVVSPGGLGFPRVANLLKSVGDVHASLVYVDFPDAPATRTPQSVFAILSPGAENYYAAVSYGRMHLIFDSTFVWRRMSEPSTQDASFTADQQRAYVQEAVNLASPAQFALADAIVVMANPDAVALPSGGAYVGTPTTGVTAGGRTVWDFATSGHDLLTWGNFWLNHEMGHMMGLVDDYPYSGTASFVGNFSIMGNINGFAREYFGFERWPLGWIDDTQVLCAPTGTSDVVLSPIERVGGTKMVVIPTGATTAIIAESRRAEGYDTNGSWNPGVLVYSVDTSIPGGSGTLRVLPFDGTDSDKGTAPLQPGESLGVGSVTVTFLSTDATGDHVRVTNGVPTLIVSSITPAPAATNVSADSIVRLVFSEAIDPTSVTSSTVSVTLGGTPVAGSLAVNGSTVTFTPTAPFTEFHSVYTVMVTPGVRSTVGDSLAGRFVSTFTTVFEDPNYYYQITNQFIGPTKALDLYVNNHNAYLNLLGGSGQNWYLVPIPNTPYTVLKNQSLGDGWALEGASSGGQSLMTMLPPNGVGFSGQNWMFTPYGAPYTNGFRLQTQFVPAASLDAAFADGSAVGLRPTANSSEQVWYFKRMNHR